MVGSCSLSPGAPARAAFLTAGFSALLMLSGVSERAAAAADWTVALHVHEVRALTNTDDTAPWDQQDMYRRISIEPLVGTGAAAHCSNEDNIDEDANHITPGDWGCTMKFSGGPDALVRIKLEVWDDDWPDGDDELDLNSDHNQLGVDMRFEPRTSKLTILGVPGWAAGRCAVGNIKLSGFGGGGEEPADIVFSVSGSAASAVDGETDGDGFFDSWEVCGLDADGNQTVDVDLPALGALPFRKDVFVEIDWMVDRTSAAPHSHEPWLPALINAWNELDTAPLTNPLVPGAQNKGGISLHVDVGTLYAGYVLDVDGAPPNEFSIAATGNIDLDNDVIPDIGNLGARDSRGIIEGRELVETATLQPNAATPPNFFGSGSTFAAIKTANFAPARAAVFHYALLGHAFNAPAIGLPAGSGGLGEAGTASNDFMVTFGTVPGAPAFGRQTRDLDRDGVPDVGATVLTGPSNLPVDGTFTDHVSTFLHELGHNFSLRHGGGLPINNNPNYLSIMNPSFGLSGLAYDNLGNDGLADTVGVDHNEDGITDVRRFHYSFPAREPLSALNEASLDETKPIWPSVPNAPAPPLLTTFSCPPGSVPPFPIVRADRPVNWDCDRVPGEQDASGVKNVTNTNVNNLTPGNASPPNEILLGFADHLRIENSGLDFTPNFPGLSMEEKRLRNSMTQRILEPPGREWFRNRCAAPREITFEDAADGTAAGTHYAPLVRFLADTLRAPTVVGPGSRNSVPTSSPQHSLLNQPRLDAPTPLVMRFDPPQRVVSLHFGQAGLTNAPRERVRAVLRAFDQHDVAMGQIVRDLPLPSAGISEPVTVAAIFPDELIQRVELHYEAGVVTGPAVVPVALAEPVQIDDLLLCGRLDETGIKPYIPPQPEFGDLHVKLDVRSEALLEVPGGGAPGKTTNQRNPFTGLPIQVDGQPATTNLQLARPEGTTLELEAPVNYVGGRFLYWRHSTGVSFGNGMTKVPLTLLRDGTITAVYEARRLDTGPAREPPVEERLEGIGRCIEQCFRLPGAP
jgi:hypothetical protein